MVESYVINNAVNMKDPSGRSLEIITGLEKSKANINSEIQSLLKSMSQVQGMAKMEIQSMIDKKRTSVSELDKEIERQLRFQKGQTTTADIAYRKEKDAKIEEMIAAANARLNLLKNRCDNPALGYKGRAIDLLENEFLSWLTDEQKIEMILLSQDKNKIPDGFLDSNNPLKEMGFSYVGLTIADLDKLGIDKNNEDNLALFNFAVKVNMLNTSVAETAFHYESAAVQKNLAGLGIFALTGMGKDLKIGFSTEIEGAGKITGNDIKFSDKFSKPAYKNQVAERGWTNQSIADAINNPAKTGISVNKYTGNPVTAYYIDDVHYVAVDNVTGKVIQVADINKANWVFDLTK